MSSETWTKQIIIGGVPLALYELTETVVGEFDGLNKRVFAIEMIKRYGITPVVVDPSADAKSFSFVWKGKRLSMSQDVDGKLYTDLVMLSNPSSISDYPTYELIFYGVPLALSSDREIVFHDSEYTIDDVEKYDTMMFGGMPHTVGRVENKWYWIVNPIKESELPTLKGVTPPLGEAGVSNISI